MSAASAAAGLPANASSVNATAAAVSTPSLAVVPPAASLSEAEAMPTTTLLSSAIDACWGYALAFDDAIFRHVREYAPFIVAAVAVLLVALKFHRHRALAKAKRLADRVPREYDVVVIGASIAGPPLAIQLARQGRNVLVIEDNLERPDRIVGELLQPGGLAALRTMGLEECARSVGVPCSGYVSCFDGQWVQLPYEDGIDGVSFHFGDFVMKLRERMAGWNETAEGKSSGGKITVVEANATEMMKEPTGNIVVGVKYRMKETKATVEATCHLVALCDGGYSKFRPTKKRQQPHSYFVGVILKGLKMPYESRGHVMLARSGPVLSYRLHKDSAAGDDGEVRILVDLPCTDKVAPPPAKLRQWLESEIMPQLPEDYQRCLSAQLERSKTDKGVIRSHPHFHFTPIFPTVRGVVPIGDSTNQRHPLTGAGMTCALRDAFFLAEELKAVPYFGDHDQVHARCLAFLRSRPKYVSVVNLLSWALHGVFRGRESMKRACFAYFRMGGECVTVPMAFLSAINSSVALLLYHYVRVAVLGAFIVFTGGKLEASGFDLAKGLVNPGRWVTAMTLLFDAFVIFFPLIFTEFGAFGHLFDPTVVRL